jgi:hypothetical protein
VAICRRSDQGFPSGIRSRGGRKRALPQVRIVGCDSLLSAEHIGGDERVGRAAPLFAGGGGRVAGELPGRDDARELGNEGGTPTKMRKAPAECELARWMVA